MPEQDLDGLVLAITARLQRTLPGIPHTAGERGSLFLDGAPRHPSDIGMHHDQLSRCCSGHLRSARRRDVVLERTYASRLRGMG